MIGCRICVECFARTVRTRIAKQEVLVKRCCGISAVAILLIAASGCRTEKFASPEHDTVAVSPPAYLVGPSAPTRLGAVLSSTFRGAVQGPLDKGCGGGLTQDSSTDACVYVLGILVHSEANVQHYCVHLPAGKSDRDMMFAGEVADGQKPVSPAFRPCADPSKGGACDVGYSRFETTEYYPGPNNLCGRFKNWSNTTDRVVR